MFAEQTRPVITGPNELELLDTGMWTCVTEEVTVDYEKQYGVSFVTSPEIPIETKRKKTSTLLNQNKTPKR